MADNYFNQSTERLVLRPLTESDIPKWYAFFENNDRLDYLGLDLTKNHKTNAEEWVRAQFNRYAAHGLGHLAIDLKATGEFIGLAGIIPREVLSNQEFEIAYSFIPKYWGQGYATEACQELKTFGFNHLNIERLISIIAVNNTPSAHVAIKNGMSVLFETQYLGMDVNVFGISRTSSASS